MQGTVHTALSGVKISTPAARTYIVVDHMQPRTRYHFSMGKKHAKLQTATSTAVPVAIFMAHAQYGGLAPRPWQRRQRRQRRWPWHRVNDGAGGERARGDRPRRLRPRKRSSQGRGVRRAGQAVGGRAGGQVGDEGREAGEGWRLGGGRRRRRVERLRGGGWLDARLHPGPLQRTSGSRSVGQRQALEGRRSR